jgi:putative tricarboxylic transport membrane protein
MHGLQPGPLLMTNAPDLFWGTIVSMYVGNVMLLVLNLPLIGLWVRVLKIPYYLLYPLILLFCLIGSYSIGNNTGDMVVMLVFGILGYLMKKFGYSAAPMVLALVLGNEIEAALRQSLMLSKGHFSVFVERPISLGLLLVAAMLVILPLITKRKRVSTLEEQ